MQAGQQPAVYGDGHLAADAKVHLVARPALVQHGRRLWLLLLWSLRLLLQLVLLLLLLFCSILRGRRRAQLLLHVVLLL